MRFAPAENHFEIPSPKTTYKGAVTKSNLGLHDCGNILRALEEIFM